MKNVKFELFCAKLTLAALTECRGDEPKSMRRDYIDFGGGYRFHSENDIKETRETEWDNHSEEAKKLFEELNIPQFTVSYYEGSSPISQFGLIYEKMSNHWGWGIELDSFELVHRDKIRKVIKTLEMGVQIQPRV